MAAHNYRIQIYIFFETDVELSFEWFQFFDILNFYSETNQKVFQFYFYKHLNIEI